MWRTYGFSGDAGEGPSPEELERWRRRMSAPENEVPQGVGLTLVLGRTADLAVALTRLEAFSTGFRFALVVRLRAELPDAAQHGLFELIAGHPHPGVQIPVERKLLLGVEYADGRTASNIDDPRWQGPAAPAVPDESAPVLVANGGGGGGLSFDQTFWVSPLPPPGPLTFVHSWTAFDLPETRTTIDAGDVLAAAAETVLLWPWQPPDPNPPPPPAPLRPAAGWFARNSGDQAGPPA